MSKKEELAKKYAENCYQYDEDMRFQCEYHFESGWDEALKEIIVDARKELPEYDEDVWVINEYGDKFFCHRSNDPNVVVDKDGWCNYSGCDIVAWIRNPTFEEIISMNKDVLKRLKDK
ncbi:hypothetical protein MUN53_14340 [Parabacteroides sp. AGMB00274]|uniref:DUF551 domain-containing protein n=1 Tax=Parabacteroides faecalis TaxID=2924040 RepID=A0ABT0C4E9_9BACT|nr:hypothetical protein [Parabacteroides faecalis]MCJ2381768.1 hypothetical protein [Parabacteroides faecalis]